MRNSQRFRFPKTVLFGITTIFLITMVLTYVLYYKEPTIACAKRLMLMQALSLLFQVFLNYINYHSKNKIVILATLFISAMLVAGVISSFFMLRFTCSLFPMPV